MEALFTNPLTMLAGAALVSAPIIIHLINRMRFRKVKWAAMEFLLKAQKRMRRKLIVEQLILLLLRCLLVFLVGMLLARFKWFSPMEGEESRATAHVVVIDDSPSMADAVTAEGRRTTAFDQARSQVVEKIAPAAAQASTPQSMDLLLLSDLANPRPVERLNDSSISGMKDFLAAVHQPSPVRVSLVDGLRRAKEVLDKRPDSEVAKVIHVVSDLRNVDWVEDGETLKQLVSEFTTAGIRVHLIDVAYPNRKESDRQPRSSDNVGIVEFRPRAKTAARGQPVEFVLRVLNSGNTELKDVRLEFFLNGKRWNDLSARISSIPANQERTEVITATTGITRVGTKENPLDRFSLVTAKLADVEAGGIAADNVRHTVVEVLDRLSVLVIQGRQQLRDNPKGDGYYLKRLFQDSFGGINWVDGREDDLDRQDLRQYASVYLLNVPALTASQRDKLEAYVRGGGGVGVLLGPNVKPDDYNKVLYRGGDGMFPVPLPDRYTEPPTDEQKNKVGRAFSKRVLTRDPSVKGHPALVGLYTNDRGGAVKDIEIEKYFVFSHIDQHWPIARFGKWLEDKAVQELYCLPNEQPMSGFDGPAKDLLDKLRVKIAEPKFEKYRQYVEPLADKIRKTTASDDDSLSFLATVYDRLLCDQINDGDPSEPILREFWSQPELSDLRPAFQRERNRAKFGDPLYLVKQFGQGRVAVMTTDAGGTHPSGAWTDWPFGAGAVGWLAVMSEMQKYLSGGAVEENRSVGSVVSATFEAAKYKPTVSRLFMTTDPEKAERSGDIPVASTGLGDQPLEANAGSLTFRFAEAKKPGLYLCTFTRLDGPNGEVEKPEYVPYVFNVDAQREGNLRRVSREDLAQSAPKVPVHSPDDTSWVNNLKQKRDDFSTRRWLYLFILLVLIAEQAMAVRLSFHTRPEDVESHAPSAAAAYARGAAATSDLTAQAAEPQATIGV